MILHVYNNIWKQLTLLYLIYGTLENKRKKKNKNVCLKYRYIYIFYLYMRRYIHNKIKNTNGTVFMVITGHMVTADIL